MSEKKHMDDNKENPNKEESKACLNSKDAREVLGPLLKGKKKEEKTRTEIKRSHKKKKETHLLLAIW